ncbi:MAG: hypothetical protein ACJ8FY_13420 [Gemmataceae bacterium]
MSKKPSQKPYWEMSTEQLADATAEFDRDMIVDSFGPLSPEMKSRWEAAKAKRDRLEKSNGVQVITVSVRRKLLAKADTLAKKMGISRAGMIERGLKAVLAAEGEL